MPTPEVEWIEGIRVPTLATLKKHGHTRETWLEWAKRQDFRCALESCRSKPDSGILHIDHYHVRGYAKMPPEKRRLYTRGLLCQFCNRRILTRFHTLERTKAVLSYLLDFEERMP